MSDKYFESIMERLKDIGEDQKDLKESFHEFSKNVEVQSERTKHEIERIHDLDEVQNKLLDEHIQGVKTLKSMYKLQKKEYDERLGKVELPQKAFTFIAKVSGGVTAIIGAIYGVLKFFEVL